MKNKKLLLRSAGIFLASVFLFTSISIKILRVKDAAAAALDLPLPTSIIQTSNRFSYPVLKGVSFNKKDPFLLKFYLSSEDKGDVDRKEVLRLSEYFLAMLTVPLDDIWVNLSPYEEDRIIPQAMQKTRMGRDMLIQDYLLKQLVSSLTYPETETGKQYWDYIYEKMEKELGTTVLPVRSFNKVYIVPDFAQVKESSNGAYIECAYLKALLEEDIKAQAADFSDEEKKMHSIAAVAAGKFILPAIEQEINYGENFALLRQIYYSVILGIWFKEKYFSTVYGEFINAVKISSISSQEYDLRTRVYGFYQRSCRKGVYDFSRVIFNGSSCKTSSQRRRYFSGGISFLNPEEWLACSALENQPRSEGRGDFDWGKVIHLFPQKQKKEEEKNTIAESQYEGWSFGSQIMPENIYDFTAELQLETIKQTHRTTSLIDMLSNRNNRAMCAVDGANIQLSLYQEVRDTTPQEREEYKKELMRLIKEKKVSFTVITGTQTGRELERGIDIENIACYFAGENNIIFRLRTGPWDNCGQQPTGVVMTTVNGKDHVRKYHIHQSRDPEKMTDKEDWNYLLNGNFIDEDIELNIAEKIGSFVKNHSLTEEYLNGRRDNIAKHYETMAHWMELLVTKMIGHIYQSGLPEDVYYSQCARVEKYRIKAMYFAAVERLGRRISLLSTHKRNYLALDVNKEGLTGLTAKGFYNFMQWFKHCLRGSWLLFPYVEKRLASDIKEVVKLGKLAFPLEFADVKDVNKNGEEKIKTAEEALSEKIKHMVDVNFKTEQGSIETLSVHDIEERRHRDNESVHNFIVMTLGVIGLIMSSNWIFSGIVAFISWSWILNTVTRVWRSHLVDHLIDLGHSFFLRDSGKAIEELYYNKDEKNRQKEVAGFFRDYRHVINNPTMKTFKYNTTLKRINKWFPYLFVWGGRFSLLALVMRWLIVIFEKAPQKLLSSRGMWSDNLLLRMHFERMRSELKGASVKVDRINVFIKKSVGRQWAERKLTPEIRARRAYSMAQINYIEIPDDKDARDNEFLLPVLSDMPRGNRKKTVVIDASYQEKDIFTLFEEVVPGSLVRGTAGYTVWDLMMDTGIRVAQKQKNNNSGGLAIVGKRLYVGPIRASEGVTITTAWATKEEIGPGAIFMEQENGDIRFVRNPSFISGVPGKEYPKKASLIVFSGDSDDFNDYFRKLHQEYRHFELERKKEERRLRVARIEEMMREKELFLNTADEEALSRDMEKLRQVKEEIEQKAVSQAKVLPRMHPDDSIFMFMADFFEKRDVKRYGYDLYTDNVIGDNNIQRAYDFFKLQEDLMRGIFSGKGYGAYRMKPMSDESFTSGGLKDGKIEGLQKLKERLSVASTSVPQTKGGILFKNAHNHSVSSSAARCVPSSYGYFDNFTVKIKNLRRCG